MIWLRKLCTVLLLLALREHAQVIKWASKCEFPNSRGINLYCVLSEQRILKLASAFSRYNNCTHQQRFNRGRLTRKAVEQFRTRPFRCFSRELSMREFSIREVAIIFMKIYETYELLYDYKRVEHCHGVSYMCFKVIFGYFAVWACLPWVQIGVCRVEEKKHQVFVNLCQAKAVYYRYL